MGQLFNACDYLLDRRLAAGDSERVALRDIERAWERDAHGLRLVVIP